jgi:hypothetical protein
VPAASARHHYRAPDTTDDHDDANSGPAGDGHNHLAVFRQRLAAGDYDAILGQGARQTLHGAAADSGLEAEIGALRLTLARLLNEEQDPAKLAAGVSRVAGVAIQAARLRQSGSSELDEVRTMLLRELDAVERDAAERAQPLSTAPRKEVNQDDTHQRSHGKSHHARRRGRFRRGTGKRVGTQPAATDHQPGTSHGLRGGDPANGRRPD